jgi:limonene-1,2-epoxide hydrolase
MTINDKRVALHAAGVFEMDSDGKIAMWRDHGDREERGQARTRSRQRKARLTARHICQ